MLYNKYSHYVTTCFFPVVEGLIPALIKRIPANTCLIVTHLWKCYWIWLWETLPISNSSNGNSLLLQNIILLRNMNWQKWIAFISVSLNALFNAQSLMSAQFVKNLLFRKMTFPNTLIQMETFEIFVIIVVIFLYIIMFACCCSFLWFIMRFVGVEDVER